MIDVSGFEVRHDGPWLVADLGGPHAVISWAIVNGGRRLARAVAWLQVRDGDLPEGVDPRALLSDRMEARGLAETVGLMTSSPLSQHVLASRRLEGLAVDVLATVGMKNALAAGDLPEAAPFADTINVLCRVGSALSEEAMVEALALVAEARTAAVLDAAIPSPVSGLASTGTGTDCIVVAAPESGPPLRYAGKHTLAGHLVGAAVREAIARGISRWKERPR